MSQIFSIPPDLVRGPEYDVLPSAGEVNWGMAKFDVERLRIAAGGVQIPVGIVDTGVDKSHPLLGNVAAAKDFTGSAIGSGDRNGHGTHCSATVGGSDPRIGVFAGTPLYHGKGLSDSGSGSMSDLLSAMEWCFGQGCTVVSCSWGGGTLVDPGTDRKFREWAERGLWCIFAAGNSGGNTDQTDAPGNSPHVLNVAALDSQFRVASFSSAGAKIDTSGPGVDIISAKPGGGFQSMSGTCIAEREYVYGPQGPRPISEVKVGDTVYAQKNGKLVERVVYGVHERGTAEVHKLSVSGRDVLATSSHQMFVFDTVSGFPDWVPLGQLQKRHLVVVPREMPSQVNPYLDALLTADFCWLAGFFTGDGWVSATNGGMRTSFSVKANQETNAKVERLYHQIVGKHLRCNKNGNWNYDDCTQMAMIISSIGLSFPSSEKTVPLWVWSLSREKQVSFYEGYRAADGHQHKSEKHNGISDSFECSSGDLVRRLACLSDYFGWKRGAVRSRTRTLQAPNSPTPKESTSHQLSIYRTPFSGHRGNGAESHADIERKAQQSGIDMTSYALSHHTVMERYSQQSRVFDLTVPDADCFVTNGIVTHNSMATPFVAGTLAMYRAALGLRRLAVPSVYDLRKLLQSDSTDAHTPGIDRRTGPGWVSPLLLTLNLTELPRVG